MQVFVPIADSFQASIACLDWRRLGKQRVECSQILSVLRSLRAHETAPGTPVGWARHPAVQMWRGCDSALAVYYTMCVAEWIARGYVNNMALPYDPATFLATPGWWDGQNLAPDGRDATLPVWWGRPDVHESHRGNLLRKDPEHYDQFGWREQPMDGYVWASSETEEIGI